MIKSNLAEYLEHAPEEEIMNETVEASESSGSETTGKNTGNKSGNVIKSIIIKSPMTGLAGGIETAPDEGFAQK